MLNRRELLASAIAAGALGAMPAYAQRAAGYAVPQEFLPKRVRLQNDVAPGEIHVDPVRFRLYWTLENGQAIEYTVGVGRDNLYESGTFFIGAKKEWPAWTPTRDMIARQPELYAQWAGGMPGGPNNPLGARALYLFTKERGDTFLRIHGTNDPRTINMAVSNGCTRLVNDHAIDLYEKVPMNTRVVLHPKGGRPWAVVASTSRSTFRSRRREVLPPEPVETAPAAQSEPAPLCRDVLGRLVSCNP